MGVMNRLRESTGVILWILVFAFGVIWVLQDSGGLDVVGVLSNNVGSVNGEAITFEEYSQALDTQVQNYQQQAGDAMPPQALDQARDRVFDQLVELKLRQQEQARLGLTVSDSELVEMVQGATPHPIISLYFGDGQGGVDRALLQSFIDNPEASADWIKIEEYLRNERLREKLDNLVVAGARVSDADLAEEYDRRNRSVDVRFVALRFAEISNDSIEVSDRELSRFYDDHKDEFERKRSVSYLYVSRDKKPTAEDSAIVMKDLEDLRASFAEATDDSVFLARNGSDTPFADSWVRPDELDQTLSDAVFANPVVGAVVGPVIAGGKAHLVKIRGLRAPEEVAVRARHILFRAAEGDDAAKQAARKQAGDILARIRAGEDFAEMARTYSTDGSAASGGDLGWFGPGRMVKPFEDAAFAATVGRVVGPVETQFGYHLIEVTDRATQEISLADYSLPLKPSMGTLNSIQSQLDDLQYFAEDNGDFAAEAGRLGLQTVTVEIEDEQPFIPVIGNSTTLTNFLLDAEVGAVSPVIELNEQFIAGVVTGIQKAGYRPLDEVRAQIEPRVRNEKKAEMLRNRLETALKSGSFDGLAAATRTAEGTAQGLSYSNMIVPGLGREPKFVGAALGLKAGETSGVIEGTSAVFVIQVTQAYDPFPLDDAGKTSLRDQLLSQKQNALRTRWIADLREKAEVVDNRRKVLIQ